jgi:hypothetical protein
VVPFEISMLTSSWYLFWYISWMITNKRYMENIRTYGKIKGIMSLILVIFFCPDIFLKDYIKSIN